MQPQSYTDPCVLQFILDFVETFAWPIAIFGTLSILVKIRELIAEWTGY